MDRPLSGVRVLDLGQIYMGGYCGMLLAHLGAEVVKIEPPWGDNVRSRTEDRQSPQFQFLNANKRGLTLDLKSDEGKRVLEDLVAEADVLFENFARGTMDGLDLGYDRLSEVNPGLIFAHGSGYGDDGPYADYPAMDLAIQAMGGVMHTTGFPDGPPVKAGPAICDFLGGTHLVAAITSALFQREHTGEGQYIDVAMLDCTFPTMASPVASWALQRDAPPRTGNQHSALDIAPYNAYEAADGYLIIICVSERHWEGLCEAMGRPELTEDERFETRSDRADHREEIDAIIEDWLADAPRDETVEALIESHVPSAPVQTTEEVLSDPQLQARNMLNYLPNQSEGTDELPVPGLPMKFSGSGEPDLTPAPVLGEHSAAVLRSIAGYADEEIETLERDDVI